MQKKEKIGILHLKISLREFENEVEKRERERIYSKIALFCL